MDNMSASHSRKEFDGPGSDEDQEFKERSEGGEKYENAIDSAKKCQKSAEETWN